MLSCVWGVCGAGQKKKKSILQKEGWTCSGLTEQDDE